MKLELNQLNPVVFGDGYRPNVGIIITNNEGKVFWARRITGDGWQFPQGGLKPSESLLQGMYRELLEETGFHSDDMVFLGDISGNPVRYTNRAYLFLAQNVQEVAVQDLDEMEDIEVVLMSFESLVTQALSGEMQHPHHMAALLLALNHLGKIHV